MTKIEPFMAHYHENNKHREQKKNIEGYKKE
jgi:hypothetical protein